nr:hypothetical protein [Tanacetum cinerariifolium]
MQKRKNDVKARTTLLLSLPDEHQLRFSKYKTAQELWAAILKTLGGVVVVPTGSGSIPIASPPAAEVPTGSDVVPTASLVFATATVVTPYRRRKGKEVMVESKTLKKQKVQEQIDAQVARELEEQLERERRSKKV